MALLSPDELRGRLKLDYKVCKSMFMQGHVFSGDAYRSTHDLKKRRNPILSPDQGHLARLYLIDYYVKTLVGRGQFSDITTIAFSLDVKDYPVEEPHAWVVAPSMVPYSPHFSRVGELICIGDIWTFGRGHMLLGSLLVHVAKLLNWDGRSREDDNNREAIDYYLSTYGDRPITENLRYPTIPPEFLLGSNEPPQTPLFQGLGIE